MSDRARRKEKHRIKRQQKHAAMRRTTAISPYKRLAQGTEIEACYINENWREAGIAAIRMIGRGPAGGLVFGAFLIDIWCIGLKDAFGRLNVNRDEVEEHIKRDAGDVTIVRIDPDKARKLIAGAIRFSRQNGFRLPKNYDRWTAMLGDLGDVASADISDFGKDGGLRFVGELDDLKVRLIGCSVEDFLARPDMQFLAEIGGATHLDLEEVEEEELSEEFNQKIEEATADFRGFRSICTELVSEYFHQHAETPPLYWVEAIWINFLNATQLSMKDIVIERRSMDLPITPYIIILAMDRLLSELGNEIAGIKDDKAWELAIDKTAIVLKQNEDQMWDAFFSYKTRRLTAANLLV